MAAAPVPYVDLLPPPLAGLTGSLVPAPFCVLRVHGPDAVDFVHRLSSQDVVAMAEGEVRPAAFLSPKGKLETLVMLGKAGGAVWLEAQAQDGARLHQLLERYHFTEKLAITPFPDWACAQVVGAAAWGTDVSGAGIQVDPAGARWAAERRGLHWLRWHGPAAHLPQLAAAPLTAAQWQVLRIAAGLAWVGSDVDANNLGLEADIDDYVSLTKGCYTGQEIVARIHTYGHVNRRLVRAVVTGAALPEPGAAVVDADGEPVGRVTSVAAIAADRAVTLAMLPYELSHPGTQLMVGTARLAVA